MAKTIAALFEHRTEAQGAVEDLVVHGFARNEISLMGHEATSSAPAVTADEDASGLAQGAGIGAAAGGIGGLVLGLTALAVPGVGPVLAAGPLAAALLGAGVGAAAGGLIGALTNMGIPEEHAHYYGEGVRRGGVLVTVATTEARAEEAVAILSRHHPIDVSRRAEEWRQSGWTRFEPQAEPSRAPAATQAAGMARTAAAGMSTHTDMALLASAAPAQQTQLERDTTIPVVEEDIEVGKRAATRHVQVSTTVREQPVEQQVHLREEQVTVERHPVDRPASAADQAAMQDRTLEMTETVEEPVVSKRAHVVEDVVVHKDATERIETVRETARRTDVQVEHAPATQGTGVRGFDTYDAGFRRHFTTAVAQQPGATYDTYLPAYRYGYTLATDPRYSTREWALCEADARRDWERDHPGTWERFKAAMQHAWEEVRGHR